jgi:hypothetical protein
MERELQAWEMNINSAVILIFNWKKKPISARKNRERAYFTQHYRKNLLATPRQMATSQWFCHLHNWDGDDFHGDGHCCLPPWITEVMVYGHTLFCSRRGLIGMHAWKPSCQSHTLTAFGNLVKMPPLFSSLSFFSTVLHSNGAGGRWKGVRESELDLLGTCCVPGIWLTELCRHWIPCRMGSVCAHATIL